MSELEIGIGISLDAQSVGGVSVPPPMMIETNRVLFSNGDNVLWGDGDFIAWGDDT